MNGPRGFDLDGETSRAWTMFARLLADSLAALDAGQTMSLEPSAGPRDEHRATSTMLFEALPDGLVRRTVVAIDEHVRSEQVSRQRDADSLAAETLRLLRDDLGVVHPAFLTVNRDGHLVEHASGAPWAGATTELVPTMEQLTEPADAQHLLELAFDTITLALGRKPERDIDGDIVIESGSTRVLVRVLGGTPVVQLSSRLVHHVAHPMAAPGLVAALNGEYPFVKFLYADGAVLASTYLPATPFVPAQLRQLLATFTQLADQLDDELVRRLGGDREIDTARIVTPSEPGEPDGVPPELLTLVQLDPEGQGLDAERTAEVCSYDRALTRQLLHIAAGQEEVWQAAAEDGEDDPDLVARCAGEAAVWQATRRSLASALELLDALEG